MFFSKPNSDKKIVLKIWKWDFLHVYVCGVCVCVCTRNMKSD